MIFKAQIQSAKNLCISKSIKYLFINWHSILIVFYLLVNWQVVTTHPLLYPITKNILLRRYENLYSILPIRKFYQLGIKKLLCTSFDKLPFHVVVSIRFAKNNSIIHQINLYLLSFTSPQILQSKCKAIFKFLQELMLFLLFHFPFKFHIWFPIVHYQWLLILLWSRWHLLLLLCNSIGHKVLFLYACHIQ